MKKGSPKSQSDQIDEHNLPTEPLPDISAMLLPIPDQHGSLTGDRTIPSTSSPQPEQQYFPPIYPYPSASNIERYQYTYPYSPGTSPAFPATNYGVPPANAAWNYGRPRPEHVYRRTFLPTCVGLFFVCVQLLLIVRFVVRLLNLSVAITWVGVVTGVSEIFILPFRILWFQIPSVGTLFLATLEVYALVAILIYGVFSRLLVHILKALLNGR
jgi:hypothetical protein